MQEFPKRPVLFCHALPEVEREQATYVASNLDAMGWQLGDLAASVDLYKWARLNGPQYEDENSRQLLHKWSIIGARAGALHIYGYYQNLQGFNGALSKCPSINNYNKRGLSEARKQFEQAFPDFTRIRLSAAHPGEFSSRPEKMKEHVFTEGIDTNAISSPKGTPVFLEGNLIDGAFTSTIGNKIVSYRPDIETVKILQNITQLLYDTIAPAFDAIKADFLDRQAQH